MRKLFGTDGIRAIAGAAPLDKPTIHAIGIAIAKHLGHQPRLILGMDTRESGPWIASTLTAGLTSAGATVESAGIITTPAIAYLARKHGFSAGIVISASHNPWQDNGIKIFGGDGYKLPDETELAIEAEIERVLATTTTNLSSRPERSPVERPAAQTATDLEATLPTNDAYRAEYVRFLLDAVPNLSLDNRTVVIDCANGAASSIAPQLFANLGGTVEVTHASPNGRNINADCGALHPEIVAAEVQRRGASMGFTFDGDADRALFADEHGNVVNGDAVMLACARDLQSRGELANNLVVATTMSNMGLEAAFARSGITMLRAPVGDKYVLERMRSSDASLGGEQSGHILFPAKATTGDGLLTALLVLDVVHRSGKTLGELIADLKNYPQMILNVKVREKVPLDTLPTVVAAIAAAEQDLATTGRVVIRYSGTEALARVMIEAESESKMRHHANTIADAIRSELGV
jgi:phosphoglucosamine mutase